MKRMFALALCIVLTVSCAMAEETQRKSVVLMEGMNEEVVESLWKSDSGYEIWYPSEYLKASEKYGHECFVPTDAGEESETYFMIVSSEADAADAEALLNEAVGGFGEDAVIGEAKWSETADGSLLGSVQAVESSVIYRYYLAASEDKLLLITACFPLEAAEGFGVRFDRMAETIAFDSLQPDALYEGEGYSIGYFSEALKNVQVNTHEGFVPAADSEESGICLMIVRSGVAPEHADAMLGEAVGGYEGYYAVTWGEEKALENGLTLNWVEAEQEGWIDRYYLIKGDDTVYCLTAAFPVMGEADYGAMFDAMAETFELTEAE